MQEWVEVQYETGGIRACVYVNMFIYMCIYTYICPCMYVYTFICCGVFCGRSFVETYQVSMRKNGQRRSKTQ